MASERLFFHRTDFPVPENIQIFRTISSMLSYVPRSRLIEPLDNLNGGTSQFSEKETVVLKISDAFAQLANIYPRDVLAVSMNPEFCKIGIMTSMNSGEAPTLPGPSRVKNWLSGAVKVFPAVKAIGSLISYIFILTRNDRIGDTSTHSGSPSPEIIPAKPPSDLGDRTAFQYVAHLEDHW